MTDELLQRAARALRDDGGPPVETDREGRQRVLAGLAQAQRAQARRTAVVLAVGAVLAASTAVAAATGQLPALWQALRATVGGGERPAVAQRAQAHAAQGRAAPHSSGRPANGANLEQPAAVESVAGPPVEPQAAVVPPVPPAPPLEPPEPGTGEQSRAPGKLTSGQRHVASVSQRGAAPRGAPDPAAAGPVHALPEAEPAQPAPPPLVDESLALFRDAQRAHAGHQWATALAAWERYLQRAPDGALAPEARWSKAVCLLRLGKTAEARQALLPFARASAGSYRQADAQALLAELEATP